MTITTIRASEAARAISRAMVTAQRAVEPHYGQKMEHAEPLVFVYGTLRRGEHNHHWLEGCRWLGEAELPGAVLHDLGDRRAHV